LHAKLRRTLLSKLRRTLLSCAALF
jgi:hypothetical protein